MAPCNYHIKMAPCNYIYIKMAPCNYHAYPCTHTHVQQEEKKESDDGDEDYESDSVNWEPVNCNLCCFVTL